MKLRRIILLATIAAACLATLTAAPQDEKLPAAPNTGRFGDASGTARKYQNYLYGVIKEKSPDQLILTKTKFGIDQTIKLNKKTKFTVDGKASSYEKFNVGDSIYVDADTERKTGELLAKKLVGGADTPTLPSAAP
jgi:hypothetical protein